MAESATGKKGKPKDRFISVETIDKEGRAARSARVEIRLAGEEIASFVVGEKATATVLFDRDVQGMLDLTATFGEETLYGSTSGDRDHFTFQFSYDAPSGFAPAVGRARCADGTTGVPCVTCQVGGASVRICV